MKRVFLLFMVGMLTISFSQPVLAVSDPPQELDPSIAPPPKSVRPEAPSKEEMQRRREEAKRLKAEEKQRQKEEKRRQKEEKQRQKEEQRRLARESHGHNHALCTCDCPYCQNCIYKTHHTPGTVVAQQGTPQTSTANKSFLDSLLNVDYSMKDYGPKMPQRLTWRDDSILHHRDELRPHFDQPKPGVGRHGMGRGYKPRRARMERDDNQLFFYFETSEADAPDRLRFRCQYYADDPLHIQRVDFTIDGFEYSYTPHDLKEGRSGKMYWEEFDNELTQADKDLVYALSHGHYIEVRYIGSDGMRHVREMTDEQIEDFYRTLELFRDLGGVIE